MSAETVPSAMQAWAAQMQAVARFEPDMPDGIVSALFLAQADVADPEADGTGATGYRYVRADSIVRTAREAMHPHGLFVTLGGVRFEDAGPLGVAVVRDVVLRLVADEAKDQPACSHRFPDAIRFPVEMGKRMTNDKATAAAMTSSLAYFLRDLLQISRLMAGDEIEQRTDGEAETAKPAADEPERKSVLSMPRKNPGDRHNNGKRPPYMPVEKSKKSAEERAADFERAEAELDDVLGSAAKPETTGGHAREPHADGTSPEALPPVCDQCGPTPREFCGACAPMGKGELNKAPVGAQGQSPPSPDAPAGATLRVVHGMPDDLLAVVGSNGTMAVAHVAEAACDWSGEVEILGRDEDIDVPCRLCGEGFEPGDRFKTDKASGVEFAHLDCIKDAAKFNPIEPSCVDSADADAVVVPGPRTGALLSLAQWVASWEGAHESKARAKKGPPVLCQGCKQPIHAKKKQRERGSERVHVDCLLVARAGTDPRKPKPAAPKPCGYGGCTLPPHATGGHMVETKPAPAAQVGVNDPLNLEGKHDDEHGEAEAQAAAVEQGDGDW